MTSPINAPPTLHAELSASSAARWMACPGSVAAQRGYKDEGSAYALEGSAAHELVAHCLIHDADPEDYLGREIVVPKGGAVEVDREMVDAAKVYVAECRKRSAAADFVRVEQTFNLNTLMPPAAMFGTADFVAYHEMSRHLTVVDLKYGKGVLVEADGNPQLRYYALGALLAIEKPVTTVTAVIVQPRAGGIREATIDAAELIEWTADLMEAAKATQAKDAPRRAGTWCRFCKAKASCDELRRHALATTQAAFDDGGLDDLDAEMVGPNAITDEQLGKILDRADEIETWLRAVRAEAFKRMQTGREVAGWKLVLKRPTRKWTDEGEAEGLLDMLGVPEDQLWTKKLITPAQAEKKIGKEARGRLSVLVSAVSSGPTLARSSDPRPAVAGEGFTALADDEDV